MQYRRLGKTDWQISAISLGAWNIGGQWGHVPDRTAIETIQAALDAGVNLVDTADAYGNPMGRSERLVGQALKGKREQYFIASKVGNWGRRHGHPLPYTHATHVHACCDASLYRLGTDYIDLYQCHIGNLEEPDVFLEAFDELLEAGKIRAFGISTNNLDVVKAFNRDGKCATVQLNYSYLNRQPEEALLPYCQEHDLGTLVRGPLAQGVAADKFDDGTTFDDQVRQKWNEGEARERFLQQVETVRQCRFLKREDRTMGQAALQYVISHPGVTTAIPGAKSPDQARANAAAGEGVLSDDELAKVREVTAQQPA